ncbi:hypothetical protein KVR01_002707 [Diaporthe batatas]|uniref:uncharacterized protein n=1 Tax=Diaporthe batatas TaxID=748121 RepID=UPI001D0368A0|nr:uncharacterized protein KVR01_002707 [Diaporthe batatas]KAG8167018.1 hypothetical protein KVR01_002707 [Diaporthe batatas]
MSSLLPRVPKKAALTALRGLIVGTSCTLLLVTEDRRRRINQARSAIENAEKLCLVKQYHATRSALHQELDQPSALENLEHELSSAAYREPRRRVHKSRGPRQDDVANDGWDEPVPTSNWGDQSQQPGAQAGRPRRFFRPKSGPAFQTRDQTAALSLLPVHPKVTAGATAYPKLGVDENVRRMREAVILGDAQSIEDAVGILQKTVQRAGLTDLDKAMLVDAAVLLCQKCQEQGMLDQSEEILLCAVGLGPITVDQYYAFNPQSLIESAVAATESILNTMGTADTGNEVRTVAKQKLMRALSLFMPRFKDKASASPRSSQWQESAERMMQQAFDLDMTEQAADVFWRIQFYGGDSDAAVTRRFMTGLFNRNDFNRVVNTFSLTRHKLPTSRRKSWYGIGDLVADAVEAAQKQDPAKVLVQLLDQCPKECHVRTTWATKLLYCHWQRGQDFEATRALFDEFENIHNGRLGFRLVAFPDGVHRVMLQIAVEAGRWQAVDELLARLQQIKPSSCKDARILGLLALAKAKVGDWDGVWADFKNMEVKDRIDDVFVPILKEFTKTHTIAEIEEFMKVYITDLKVPVCRYMVNVVANQYGAIRNVELFVNWLDYCSHAGFEVDAAFSNAILVNCKRRWDFSFEELRIVFSKLKLLSRKFVDNWTENTMRFAAMKVRHSRSAFHRNVTLLGIKSRSVSSVSNITTPEDVRLEMREAMTLRHYRTAYGIYKSGLARGIALRDDHVRLAVQAQLKVDQGNPQTAFDTINAAKLRGIDVSSSISLVFSCLLRQIPHGREVDKNNFLRQVEDLIGRFESNGLSLPPAAFTRAAHACMGVRHFRGAVSLAMSALERKGVSHPLDSTTFSLFLLAFTHTVDLKGMKWAVAGACQEPYFRKKAVLRSLKDARGVLAKSIQTNDVRKAVGVLDKALDMILCVREAVAKERKDLEKDTMEIMREAALEAEQRAQNGQGPGGGSAAVDEDPEWVRQRAELLREFDEQQRREELAERQQLAAKQAEMRDRALASEMFEFEQAEQADEMERMMAESKYDIGGGF